MRYYDVKNAIAEAKRFIEKAGNVRSQPNSSYVEPGADSAAAKRASLDLTKALAKMRRG